MPGSVAARWAQWERAGRQISAAPHVAPITFPTTPLAVKVMVALDADVTASPATWGWADATSIAFTRDGIHIERGRDDETSTADSSKLALTGDNRQGHWSPNHPLSPWFGQLNMGTPIWVQAEGYSRYTGFISELPPRWDVSGNDRYAPIAARGLLYRLARGTAPARSALRRTIAASGPIAYWSLEEPPAGTFLPSGLVGGTPLRIASEDLERVGLSTFTVGSEGCIDVGIPGSATVTPLSLSGSSSTWSISFVSLLYIPSSGTAAPLFRFLGLSVSVLVYVIGQRVAAQVSSTSGSAIVYADVLASDPAGAAESHALVLTMTQNGADVSVQLSWDGTVETGGFPGTGTLASTTNSLPYAFQLADGTSAAITATTSLLLTHLAVYDSASPPALNASPGPVSGYTGEEAHTRFLRLCDEDGILATCGGSRSISMGVQGVKTLVDLLRECEASDQGYLYEGVAWDLVFQTRAERYNVVAALELDYTTDGHISPPLEPTDDDQRARNDVEVKRDGGSSDRATEDDPNVERSIPRIGRRDESVTYILADDESLLDLASWRLHVGTTPGFRYPTLTVSLLAAPSLIPALCAAGLAYRATVANPPLDVGAETIDVMVEGYAETLNLYDWLFAANCSPFRPNDVLQIENGAANTSRINPAATTLDVAYGTGDVSLAVTSPTDGTRWVDSATYPTDFPIDIVIAGEPMVLTAVVGTTASQTFTVTRGGAGFTKALPAGSLVQIQRPPAIAL